MLVEAAGRRIFYTGDFRGHGRKHSLRHLLDDPPPDIDALVMEGTNLSRVDDAAHEEPYCVSESDVELDLATTLSSTEGLVIVLCSPQNIDRAVSVYRAALRSGRRVAVDLYSADVLAATGRETIPHLDQTWPRVHAFVPLHQRVKVKEQREFARAAAVRDRRVFDDELLTHPRDWVLFGSFQRELPRLIRANALHRGAVVWSQWAGYLAEPSGERLTVQLAAAGVPLAHHHTSGHARPADLRALVDALAPRTLVPIHTASPSMFASAFGVPTRPEGDGVWWTI